MRVLDSGAKFASQGSLCNGYRVQSLGPKLVKTPGPQTHDVHSAAAALNPTPAQGTVAHRDWADTGLTAQTIMASSENDTCQCELYI